jgi:hypothetical protein
MHSENALDFLVNRPAIAFCAAVQSGPDLRIQPGQNDTFSLAVVCIGTHVIIWVYYIRITLAMRYLLKRARSRVFLHYYESHYDHQN